jgi:hypothetical protein
MPQRVAMGRSADREYLWTGLRNEQLQDEGQWRALVNTAMNIPIL